MKQLTLGAGPPVPVASWLVPCPSCKPCRKCAGKPKPICTQCEGSGECGACTCGDLHNCGFCGGTGGGCSGCMQEVTKAEPWPDGGTYPVKRLVCTGVEPGCKACDGAGTVDSRRAP